MNNSNSRTRFYVTSVAVAVLLSMSGCTAPHAAVERSADAFAAADFVDIRTAVPDIGLDIRYATADNFVGAPIDGYGAGKCYLKSAAAAALARAEAQLRSRGMRVKIFDCYRPARAVSHFVRWAKDSRDERTKEQFYPNLEKSQLLGEYIAPVSGHSRGATLDVTLMQCLDASCTELDMGTPFDFFDARAHTDASSITPAQRANRNLLRDALHAAGFENYPAEWWHFTFMIEPAPTVIYDIPIR